MVPLISLHLGNGGGGYAIFMGLGNDSGIWYEVRPEVRYKRKRDAERAMRKLVDGWTQQRASGRSQRAGTSWEHRGLLESVSRVYAEQVGGVASEAAPTEGAVK